MSQPSELHLENTALLVVDVQKGFDEYEAAGQRRNNPEAEQRIAELIAAFREKGGHIIHVRHASTETDSALRPELPGHQVKEEAREMTGEPVLVKQVNSAFIGTDLESRLRARGIENLVIVGATTNHCVETTTRMAGNLGFNALLVDDATWTFDRTALDGEVIPAELIQRITMTNLNGEFATIVDAASVIASLIAAPSVGAAVTVDPTSDIESTARATPLIRAEAISKHFGQVVALSEVSLTIERGTIALLGLNGAGKSTMLNLLTGVQRPTDGQLLVGGHLPGSDGAAEIVSRQLEFPGTASFLNPKKIVRLLDLNDDETVRFHENLRVFEVPDRPMGKLSRGNQLKVALSVSFARDRPILLLDEPTSGLDIFGVDIVSDMIAARNRRDLVTIAATHQPTLTPDLFDRALVIDHGRLLYDGGLDALFAMAPESVENDTPTGRLAAAFLQLLRGER